MKIGIDISTILNHGTDIGAGRYIFNLVKTLLSVDRENQYIFTARYITGEHLPVLEELKDERIKFKLFRTTPKKLGVWDKLRFPSIEVLGFKSDILHCPDFMIPPTNNKKIILTINDLAFIRFPHFNFEWFIKKYTKEVKKNAYTAKKIIAISSSTRNDIIRFLNVNDSKVSVTHLAADKIFRKLNPEEIDNRVFEKYGIGKKFIRSVGTIEPRKNYVTLIKAFNLIKDNHPEFDCQLVIVGRTGWKSEAAYAEFNGSPYKDNIIFVGRASDNELVHIYNSALLFVYPSIFEGFGLPVVEAMQCGLPVSASNSSSIPELMEYGQTLFNPADENDIAEKILKVINDNSLRESLVLKSLENAKRFSWEKTAKQTLEIYRSCCSG